ncbi:MAG: hypothetical protein JWQ16_2497 [Novosphingobium sp.]|nr:hypothetical protein [Novosphingobium sp.]
MMAAPVIDVTSAERALISELHQHGLLDEAITTQLAEEPDRRRLVRRVMLQLVEKRRARRDDRAESAGNTPAPDISDDELRGALGMIRGIQVAEGGVRGVV